MGMMIPLYISWLWYIHSWSHAHTVRSPCHGVNALPSMLLNMVWKIDCILDLMCTFSSFLNFYFGWTSYSSSVCEKPNRCIIRAYIYIRAINKFTHVVMKVNWILDIIIRRAGEVQPQVWCWDINRGLLWTCAARSQWDLSPCSLRRIQLWMEILIHNIMSFIAGWQSQRKTNIAGVWRHFKMSHCAFDDGHTTPSQILRWDKVVVLKHSYSYLFSSIPSTIIQKDNLPTHTNTSISKQKYFLGRVTAPFHDNLLVGILGQRIEWEPVTSYVDDSSLPLQGHNALITAIKKQCMTILIPSRSYCSRYVKDKIARLVLFVFLFKCLFANEGHWWQKSDMWPIMTPQLPRLTVDSGEVRHCAPAYTDCHPMARVAQAPTQKMEI